MVRTYKVLFLGLLAMVVLLVAPASRAQVDTGSISGTVTDQSGARVSGAVVTLTNHGSGATTQGTTSDAGFFRFVQLSLGSYDLAVAKSGFQTLQLGGISVTASAEYSTGELKMELGAQTSTVEVTAPPPLVESTQAQITSDITGQQLDTYAGIAENEGMDNLALTVPGVNMTRTDATFTNTNGVGFSVDGLRGRANDQQIDGQNNNDNSITGPSLFLSNSDFVQEYQITTGNFGAEYGRNSGSVININTKSGTNTWHGTGGGTETNSYLTTLSSIQKNPDVDLKKPPRANEEFTGGTLGGALKKDKVFVFGGFDDEIDSSNDVFVTGAQLPDPNGIAALNSCFPGSTSMAALNSFGPYAIKGGNPTPSGTPAMEYYDGAPVNNTTDPITGAAACGYEINGIQRTLPNGFHEWDYIARGDVNITNKDQVFGRYLQQSQNFLNAFGLQAQGYGVNVPSITRTVLGQWNHTFTNTFANEFRASWSKSNVQFAQNTLGTLPTAADLGNTLSFIGFTSSSLSGYGPESNFPESREVNTEQVQDNFDISKGRHQLKAGVNFTFQHTPNIFLPNYNGTYTFSDWGAYAANTPTSVGITQGNPNFSFKEYDTFWYVGDDWKIKDNLTLNLGLTYSFYGQPANLFNQITTAQQKSSTPFWDTSLPLSATTIAKIPSEKDLFGPSIGFAWSPKGRIFGGDKTVIRGGYRLTYDPVFYNPFLNIYAGAPVTLAQTLLSPSAGLLANPIGSAVRAEYASDLAFGVFDPRSFDESSYSSNFGPDRVHEWSLGFQRQLGAHAAFEARYVGNHGYDLFQSINANPYIAGLAASYPNLVPSGETPCSTPAPTIPNALGRVNCNEGINTQVGNTGFSNYNGLQTELRTTNLWNQLTLKTSYTFSKTMDNVSEIFSTFAGANSIAYSQSPVNYKGQEYGLSGLDIPNAWSLAFVENLPFFRSQQGFLGHLLGGWTVSGNYILGSGEPFTPSQIEINALSGGAANDTDFDLAFIGTLETSRPFVGSASAPQEAVGIYAADACAYTGSVGCLDPANTLISLNAANNGSDVSVSKSQVRWIANGTEADSIFGTPFGNAGRNTGREYWTNQANFSLFKNFKIKERTTIQWHMTMTNPFNHPDYTGISPFIENAGSTALEEGFANPQLQDGGIRTIYFGLKVIF